MTPVARHPSRTHRETVAERRERHGGVTDVAELLDAAARFLETRPRSVAEVRRRLVGAGYAEGLIEEALAGLARLGYLDDEAFARAWVESRDRARPRGERALRSELFAKGIERTIIDAVLDERAVAFTVAEGPAGERTAHEGPVGERTADESAARRLLDRHRRALLAEADPRKRRQRAYALLARSGFDPEVTREVASALVADLGSVDDPDAV